MRSQDLSLRQRRLVQREISREYRQWHRKLGREPRPDERKQITAIGFSKARKVSPGIPQANPDIVSAVVAGATGAIVSNALQRNPSEKPRWEDMSPAEREHATRAMEQEAERIKKAPPASFGAEMLRRPVMPKTDADIRARVRADLRQARIEKYYRKLAELQQGPGSEEPKLGELSSRIPGYMFFAFLGEPTASRFIDTLKAAGIGIVVEGGPNSKDVYVAQADFQRAIQAVRRVGMNPGGHVESNPHLEGEPCRMCGGPLGFLGQLGGYEHYQCRNCGMQFPVPAPESQQERAARIQGGLQRKAEIRKQRGYRGNPLLMGEMSEMKDRERFYTARAQKYDRDGNRPDAAHFRGAAQESRHIRERYHAPGTVFEPNPLLMTVMGNPGILVGDRVKYSRDFLRSAGMYTGPVPFAMGTVVKIEPLGDGKLITVNWGDPNIPNRVLEANLVKVGTRERDNLTGRRAKENPLNLPERQQLIAESGADARRSKWAGRDGNTSAQMYWDGQAEAKVAVAERYADYPRANPGFGGVRVEDIARDLVAKAKYDNLRMAGLQNRTELDCTVCGESIYFAQGAAAVRAFAQAHGACGARRENPRPKCNPRVCDNPSHRPKARVWKGFRGEWYWRVTDPHGMTIKVPASGKARTERGAKRAANHCLRELVGKYGKKLFAKAPVKKVAAANPSRRAPSRRKVTMSIAKFAQWVKKQNDPKLWRDFQKKIAGYQKWTHGSIPKTVTVECVEKPGVSGVWLAYNAGKQPEALYTMPKGSKRKGAWKHAWGTAPDMKNDPESKMILTKLRGKSRITDFLHD